MLKYGYFKGVEGGKAAENARGTRHFGRKEMEIVGERKKEGNEREREGREEGDREEGASIGRLFFSDYFCLVPSSFSTFPFTEAEHGIEAGTGNAMRGQRVRGSSPGEEVPTFI